MTTSSRTIAMKYCLAIVLAFALECAKALTPTSSTQSLCLTSYASESAVVSTTTVANTLTFHPPVVIPYTPSTTATPSATTVTTTITFTSTSTIPFSTSTYTSTATFVTTSTTIVTSTVSTDTTITTTTTLAATVSTVPVPSGFQYPSPTPAGVGKREIKQPVKRRGPIINSQGTSSKSPHHIRSPLQYPSKVVCYDLIEIFVPTTITTTAKKTTTVVAPTPTVTVTRSTTSTTTTSRPIASTTITTSTTTTTTAESTQTITTTTSTTTQTATYDPPPTSTYYAACANPSNQVAVDYQGNPLALVKYRTAFFQYQLDNDAYECCASCFQTPNCFGSSYTAVPSEEDFCNLLIDTTCPAMQGGIGGDYTGQSSDPYMTFSNGPCGVFNYVVDQ